MGCYSPFGFQLSTYSTYLRSGRNVRRRVNVLRERPWPQGSLGLGGGPAAGCDHTL